MNLLITGGSGQLAKGLVRYCQENQISCVALSKDELDITSPDHISEILHKIKPDVLINAAAYNQVDAAESNVQHAYDVNSHAVAHMAAETRKRNIRFVHYSSDYVFDGATRQTYTEGDKTNPINIYGQTKLAGEKAALQNNPESLILRLSWVFGDGTQNFFYKLDQWIKTKEYLEIVWDQISTPTYVMDAADITIRALEKKLTGLWHANNSGYASRYEAARRYLSIQHNSTLVIPVSSEKFPSTAKRPFFSVLQNQALEHALEYSIPSWEEALSRYCSEQP